ncbi:hypothetical protein OIU85_000699 [Salix viminalis]|uniref:At1g68980-like TPR repeats domain-containing protein n=1 Tax=Salix viminalis TaxID=40686 RepID=A0A9Q0VKI7_SALVM|nr:hypothetical protein OIU85_000699 [Salix viminalis]
MAPSLLTLRCRSPPLSTNSKLTGQFRLQTATNHINPTTKGLSLATSIPDSTTSTKNDQTLLSLLRQRKTEEAWILYTQIPHLPPPTCLSRLVSQLSYQNTPLSLRRAQSILTRLRLERQLHRLDANSLGLLAVSATKSGQLSYAFSLINSMLRSGYLPHVKAWSAVLSRLASAPDGGPTLALKLFDTITRRVRRFSDVTMVADSRPDTAAFNNVLNACANLGDGKMFLKLFEEMPEFGLEPDILTYNIMIKLCARCNRKDLLVFVLERVIEKGIPLCMTTLHSLVAAEANLEDFNEDEENEILNSSQIGVSVFEKLLPNLVQGSNREPPLLPKVFAPDSRIYTTLMKGYMKQGRVTDTVRMLEAMRCQDDSKGQPDHITYTTVISALVKAGSMDPARQVLAEMTRIGVPANRFTYNILLKGALAFFNEMRTKGIMPTKISYTTLMKAFALSGQPKLANKVFDEMLKDPRVKADLIAWNMLVEGYCRLGLVEEAKKVVQRMKENGFHPDVATYGSLANGISLARKPGEALLLWKEVKERWEVKGEGGSSGSDSDSSSLPLKPDEELLATLADVCVRAAFFQKALEIVACMEENGIPPDKTKYKKIYVEMHSRMFSSKHASQARQDRRRERKRAAEAFKFWLGLPNSYYGSEWRLDPGDY